MEYSSARPAAPFHSHVSALRSLQHRMQLRAETAAGHHQQQTAFSSPLPSSAFTALPHPQDGGHSGRCTSRSSPSLSTAVPSSPQHRPDNAAPLSNDSRSSPSSVKNEESREAGDVAGWSAQLHAAVMRVAHMAEVDITAGQYSIARGVTRRTGMAQLPEDVRSAAEAAGEPMLEQQHGLRGNSGATCDRDHHHRCPCTCCCRERKEHRRRHSSRHERRGTGEEAAAASSVATSAGSKPVGNAGGNIFPSAIALLASGITPPSLSPYRDQEVLERIMARYRTSTPPTPPPAAAIANSAPVSQPPLHIYVHCDNGTVQTGGAAGSNTPAMPAAPTNGGPAASSPPSAPPSALPSALPPAPPAPPAVLVPPSPPMPTLPPSVVVPPPPPGVVVPPPLPPPAHTPTPTATAVEEKKSDEPVSTSTPTPSPSAAIPLPPPPVVSVPPSPPPLPAVSVPLPPPGVSVPSPPPPTTAKTSANVAPAVAAAPPAKESEVDAEKQMLLRQADKYVWQLEQEVKHRAFHHNAMLQQLAEKDARSAALRRDRDTLLAQNSELQGLLEFARGRPMHGHRPPASSSSSTSSASSPSSSPKLTDKKPLTTSGQANAASPPPPLPPPASAASANTVPCLPPAVASVYTALQGASSSPPPPPASAPPVVAPAPTAAPTVTQPPLPSNSTTVAATTTMDAGSAGATQDVLRHVLLEREAALRQQRTAAASSAIGSAVLSSPSLVQSPSSALQGSSTDARYREEVQRYLDNLIREGEEEAAACRRAASADSAAAASAAPAFAHTYANSPPPASTSAVGLDVTGSAISPQAYPQLSPEQQAVKQQRQLAVQQLRAAIAVERDRFAEGTRRWNAHVQRQEAQQQLHERHRLEQLRAEAAADEAQVFAETARWRSFLQTRQPP